MAQLAHPWLRYVAIGDSFTEGVGDPEPSTPGGLRGWADRAAEVLAATQVDFAYANLAIRGRLLDGVIDGQVEAALDLKPDLVTVSAGGNDLLRPGGDPDALAARFERMIEALRRDGATVVVFTGVDTKFAPVLSTIRGKVAIYNENLRAIAEHHDCPVADMWALRSIQAPRMWTADRLHLNAYGHHEVARMLLDTLDVENELLPMQPEPARPPKWREARAQDIVWARSHLVPWVVRRIRHRSSGDGVSAKRPFAEPFFPPAAGSEAVGAEAEGPGQDAPARDAGAPENGTA